MWGISSIHRFDAVSDKAARRVQSSSDHRSSSSVPRPTSGSWVRSHAAAISEIPATDETRVR